MRIRMKIGMVGLDRVWNPGDIVEAEEAEAGRLLTAGYAEIPESNGECAAIEPPKNAMLPRARKRKGGGP